MTTLAALDSAWAQLGPDRVRRDNGAATVGTPLRTRRTLATLCGAIAFALVSGCKPAPPVNTVDYVPGGSDAEITVACVNAAVSMALFTEDPPGSQSGLDPSKFPGYDARKHEHNARAADRLFKGLVDAYRKIKWPSGVIGEGPDIRSLFRETIQVLGWTIVGADSFQANEFAWSNLENRVDWCVDHFKIDITDRPTGAQTPAAAPAPVAPVDPYRTQVLQDAAGGYRIVIEHQPD